MTGREFWTIASARLQTLRAQSDDRVVIAAQQTAEVLAWLAAPYLKPGTDLQTVVPSSLDLFNNWTGKAAPEVADDTFYTPDLEGEEIDLN